MICPGCPARKSTTSTENPEDLVDGEMLLIDCGPNYLHYTTDIARIWPVNGTYDEWQRSTYGFIVEYHKTMVGCLRPGVTPQQVYDDSAAQMLKRYKGDANATAMIHSMVERDVRYLNHSVGMSVHDNVKQCVELIVRRKTPCFSSSMRQSMF